MASLLEAAAPKSDQLNACDFLVSTKTYVIRDVVVKKDGEQRVSVFFEGCKLPWKPCKSMLRVMMVVWNSYDSKDFIGRKLTLFNDETVMWAGIAVGGIRISHMSGLSSERTLSLRTTKKTCGTYTVKPLIDTGEAETAKVDIKVQAPKTESGLPEGVSKDEFTDIRAKFVIEATEIRNEYNRLDNDDGCQGDDWIEVIDKLKVSWYALCDKYVHEYPWFVVPPQWDDGMAKLLGIVK